MTIRTSTLYARGITPVFTGSPGDGSEAAANAMGVDSSRFTSFDLEGSALGYVCGFSSVFMNGQFTRQGSIAVVAGQGWVGDYQNKTYNNIGCLRQLMTQIRYNGNTAEGTSWLVVSDYASVEDQSNYNCWGQFVAYLRRAQMDTLPHMYTDIINGAYGYDGNQHYFHQFSGIILLLSAPNQTLNSTFCTALREAIKSGVSVIVLQKGPYEGNSNFNAIYSSLGIISNGAAYVAATENALARSKAAYSNHIGWTNVPSLHIQETTRVSAAYQFNVATSAGPGSLGGQTGPWLKFFSASVDMTDDTRVSSPVFYKDKCCVEVGDGYAVSFDVTTNPLKPDAWASGLAKGTHRIDWSSTIGAGLQGRSFIFCHTVGYQRTINTGDSSYVIINGARYSTTRGFTVFQIRKTDYALIDRRSYDLEVGGEGGQGAQNAAAMAQFLNTISSAYFVLVSMNDTSEKNRTQGGLPSAMYRIGASRRIFEGSKFYYRAAYNCFGSPGVGEGNAYNEMLKGTKESDPEAYFDVGYHFDRNNNPYITGTNAITAVSMGISSLYENTKSAHMNYYKEIDVVDAQKSFGVKHNAKLTDLRFKKLPMTDNEDFVVSVENPCLPIPLVESHDWVRVYNGGGAAQVNYPFANLTEYLVTTTDDSGPNELCTSHLMMNWDMFDGVGGNIAYNEAGPDHLLSCGGDRNNPASLYFSATNGSRVWQIYQRAYNLIDGVPGRDTNDWQVHWKWNGPGSQGHNIQIDPGYEYIMFAYDRYGSLELAERHFIVPEAANLPKWGANVYNQDFSNSTLFEVSRSMAANARCTKSNDNGDQNGIMMIIRRPLYMSVGAADRTGWQLIYNDQGTAIPRGSNYGITLEYNYQYMVLASCGNGGFSTHHFNGWNKTFQTAGWDDDATIEAESCGRCQWSHDRTKLLTGTGRLSTNAGDYLSGSLAPVGVFQVYRRPILCFEPSEIS